MNMEVREWFAGGGAAQSPQDGLQIVTCAAGPETKDQGLARTFHTLLVGEAARWTKSFSVFVALRDVRAKDRGEPSPFDAS